MGYPRRFLSNKERTTSLSEIDMKRKNQTSPETKTSAFYPATNAQLAEIDFLQKEVKRLQGQINQPTSAAISVIVTPLLMHFIFFSRNAPLYFVYDEFNQSIRTMLEGFKYKIRSAGSAVIEKFHQTVDEGVTQGVCKNFPTLTPNQCFNIFKPLLNPNDGSKNLAKAAGQLKISIEKLSKLLAILDYREKFFSDTYQKISKQAIFHITKKFSNITTSILGIGIKLLIIDQLLMKLFYKGPTFSISSYITYQKDEKDAEQDILSLKIEQKKLLPRAEVVQRISKCVSIVGLPVMLYSLFSFEEKFSSPVFSITYLTMFSAVLNEGYQNIKSWRKSRNIYQNLVACKSLLNKVTVDFKQSDWEFKQNNTLESSYLWINFRKYNQFTSSFLAKNLNFYLWRQGIVTHPSARDQIILAADQVYNSRHLTTVASNFTTAITRLEEIPILEKQLTSILEKFNLEIELATPSQDENNLPMLTFEVQLDDEIIDDFLQEILNEFGNPFEIENNRLEISGFQSLTKDKFNLYNRQLKEKQRIHRHTLEAQTDFKETAGQSLLTKPLRTRFAKSQLISSDEKKSAPAAKPPITIHWGDETYQPGNDRCPVKQMRTQFPSNGRFFGIFKLKPQHMPKGSSPDFYDWLSHATLEAKIGAEKQGWKLTAPELHHDFTTEKTVPCTAKFRIFHKSYGNMRLFAEKRVAQTSEGNKTLLRIVSLVADAHRG